MLLIVNSCVFLLFVILGIVFASGKGENLIAGYNTLSEEDRTKFDQKALMAYMAKMMFGLALAWVVISVGVQIGMIWLFWAGFGLFLAVAIGSVIYMNTGNRFKR